MGNDRNKDRQSGEPADEKLSSLYSQLKHEEPSSKVDKFLLRSAKEAVGRKKTSAGNPFNGDWRMPVALAAMLVLAIGITVTLEDATRQPPMQIERTAPVETPAPRKPAAKMEKAGRRAAIPKQVETGGSSNDEGALSDAGSLPQAPQSKQKQVNENKTEITEPVPSVDSVNTRKESEPKALKSATTPAAPGSIAEKGQTKTAEQWIEQIRELVQQSRLPEARKQLTEFQHEYPDYELPKDLKALKP